MSLFAESLLRAAGLEYDEIQESWWLAHRCVLSW